MLTIGTNSIKTWQIKFNFYIVTSMRAQPFIICHMCYPITQEVQIEMICNITQAGTFSIVSQKKHVVLVYRSLVFVSLCLRFHPSSVSKRITSI